MKVYDNSGLTNDDVLREAKQHLGQLDYILLECEKRGITQSVYGMVLSYARVANLLHLTDELATEVDRRADAVVEAAVEWHECEDEFWMEKGLALEAAIDHLLELRSPADIRPEINLAPGCAACITCGAVIASPNNTLPGSWLSEHNGHRIKIQLTVE